MRYLYKYPQAMYPYDDLVKTNHERGRDQPEYELLDTGVFDGDRYFDVFVEYAKAGPEDVLIKISVCNRGAQAAALHVLPTLWFRNTWSWPGGGAKPVLGKARHASASVISARPADPLVAESLPEYHLYCKGDLAFLKAAFEKLLLNHTWWLNRKDRSGSHVFEGGFLGLDNIGVFDRSAPLPTGGYLEQADGTAWMVFFSQQMLRIAVELALQWSGKPAAIMGASVGALGTARAQYHLRQIFVFLNVLAVNQPEVMIGHAATRFDKDGNLTDEPTREHVRKLIRSLVAWTRRLQESPARAE